MRKAGRAGMTGVSSGVGRDHCWIEWCLPARERGHASAASRRKGIEWSCYFIPVPSNPAEAAPPDSLLPKGEFNEKSSEKVRCDITMSTCGADLAFQSYRQCQAHPLPHQNAQKESWVHRSSCAGMSQLSPSSSLYSWTNITESLSISVKAMFPSSQWRLYQESRALDFHWRWK
jgi:hypothetical protein